MHMREAYKIATEKSYYSTIRKEASMGRFETTLTFFSKQSAEEAHILLTDNDYKCGRIKGSTGYEGSSFHFTCNWSLNNG